MGLLFFGNHCGEVNGMHIAYMAKRLRDILTIEDKYDRDARLDIFLTDMERVYKIPFLRDEKWIEENEDEASLYEFAMDMKRLLR